jgi:flagellar assembly protein FliH
MSCKVLATDSAAAAEPIAWQSVTVAHNRWPVNQPQSAPDTGHPQQAQELERAWQTRVQQALQEGHARGEAAGAQAAAARLDPVVQRFTQTIQELAALRRRCRADAEEDAVQLAIAVARRILHREISVDPEAILGLVRSAFDKIESREIHRLRVHPEDAALVRRHFENPANSRKIEILADPSLERGSAIFDTVRGSLDASASTQLQEIERGLTDLVRRGNNA